MAILPPGSWPFGYVIEYSSRNFLAASSVSWVLMPRNTTPSSLYFRHASSNTRASARHGGHHEAQKLRKTIFPLKSSRRIVDPSKSPSVNAGAGRATRGERISLGSRPKPYASRARTATAGPRIAPRTASRLVNDCSSAAWRSDAPRRSEEHTSELQSHVNLVCRLLLDKQKKTLIQSFAYNCSALILSWQRHQPLS